MADLDHEENLDLEYIAGRPLTVGDAEFAPGDDLPQEYVDQIPLLESFINAGYIYRVHPDQGYDRLPPHIYNDVVTRKQAEDIMEGDPGVTAVIDANQVTGTKADVTETAERQAQIQRVPRKTVKITDADKASAVDGTPEKEH